MFGQAISIVLHSETLQPAIMGASVAAQPPPKFTLRDAEEKLLVFGKDEATSQVTLRRAFNPPPHMAAEDVFVEREICLTKNRGGKDRETLALEVSNHCVDYLSKKYSASSAEESKLLLKIYICDASLGNREDRIYATETGNGFIRLTLAWTLALSDGSVVLDGGRMYEHSTHMFGIGDVFRVASAERTLRAMAGRMCDKILHETAIQSRVPMCGACMAD